MPLLRRTRRTADSTMAPKGTKGAQTRGQKKLVKQLVSSVQTAEKDKKTADIAYITEQLRNEPDGTMAGTIAEWLRQGCLQRVAENISRETAALTGMLGRELPPSTRRFNRLRPDTLTALLMAFEPAIFTQEWLFGDGAPSLVEMRSWVCFALSVKDRPMAGAPQTFGGTQAPDTRQSPPSKLFLQI